MARNEMFKLEGGGITLECVVDQNALVQVYEVRGCEQVPGTKQAKFLKSIWDSMDDDAKYVIARRIEAAYGLTGILPKGRFHDVAHRMEGQHPPKPNLSAECWSLWLNPEDMGWSRGAQSPPDDYWEVLVQRRKIMDVVLHSTGKSIAQQFTSAQLHDLKMAVIAKHNTGPLEGYTGPTASEPEPEASRSRDLYTNSKVPWADPNAKLTTAPIGEEKAQGCIHNGGRFFGSAFGVGANGAGYIEYTLTCMSCGTVLQRDTVLVSTKP